MENKCENCWWYKKPMECPADFDIDTHKCKNFKEKTNGNITVISKRKLYNIP